MKRPNITPGPWEVTDSYTALFHNDLREEEVYEVNGIEAGNSPAYATSEDHAVAIAALPELLAALESALSRIEAANDHQRAAGRMEYGTHDIKAALTKAGYTFD